MLKSRLLKVILTLAVAVMAVVVLLRLCKSFSQLGMDDWREYILSFGIKAPLIFILIYTFLPITFFPASLLTIVSGFTFGMLRGSAYTIIGSMSGSTLAYAIAHYFGSDVVLKLAGKRAKWLRDSIDGNGFSTILIMRLLPVVPFNIVSYSAGLAGVGFLKHFAATAIGILPEILIYTYAGSLILEGEMADIGTALLLLLILTVVTTGLKIFLSSKLVVNK